MSPFLTLTLMLEPPKTSVSHIFALAITLCSALHLSGCSSAAQQQTVAEINALNKQETKSPNAKNEPYTGGYSPSDPPRLSADSGYDPLSPELSNTVAIPFLSFLIIEPDPIPKNAISPELERLVKARQYQDAVDHINSQIKTTPRNVQIRFVKARLQIEMRQLTEAKKTLIEITQQFPELPEPYNNLAAIAANQENWIEARDYLELALKLRPTYAIASANLGEVYIRLGAKAYENAAKRASTNQRQYSNRAKALLSVLKPQSSKPVVPAIPTSNSISTTTSPESRQSNVQSTPKN